MRNMLLIGATGFVGRQVLKLLQQQPDIQVTCLLRPGTTPPAPNTPVTIVRGDMADKVALRAALAGKHAVICCASLGFGHADNLVSTIAESSVSRAIFISTTALFTKLNAPSKAVRQAAEAKIMDSNLAWTILRPTMIYGRRGDRNMERLVKTLKWLPVLPVPGRGHFLQQPIFVDDVARAVIACLMTDTTVHKAYNISGKTALTFREIVAATGHALGRKRWILPVPLTPCRLVLRAYEKLTRTPRLKEEQLLRLNEDKAFDHEQARKDFGFEPLSFHEGINKLVKELSHD